MKRKMITIILGVTLLTACSSSTTTEPTTQSNTEASTEATTESTESTTEAPKDNGTLGEYNVTIKDATFTTDHDGKKVIIINYDFTNNSQENASALFSLNTKAFQDGIELNSAILIMNDSYDASIAQKEIKPGATVQNCQTAFILDSSSPVEFEITKLSFLDEEVKLVKTFEVQ